ncbi:hypothetical protein [Alicyclobacillus fodiniaquatilis]|uniref:Uncharacterized protein n=1 Tax=Alicyclobacillus fodiniaquatilis TaxID=1661150 RepID=A0ABW4JJZ3_9BACL
MGFLTVFVLVIVIVCILIVVLNLRFMKREEKEHQTNDKKHMEQTQEVTRQADTLAVEPESPVQSTTEMPIEEPNGQPPRKALSRSESTISDNRMPDGHYRMALRQKLKPDEPREFEKSAQQENVSEDEVYRSALRSMQNKEE